MLFKIFFRPLLIPTLITSFLLVILLFLGTWQLQRKEWKENILQREDLLWINPPILWQESNLIFHLHTKLQNFPMRRYELKGSFLENPIILIPALLPSFSKKKKDIQEQIYSFLKQKRYSFYGYKIIQPFLIEKGSIIWVDRGWIPALSVLPKFKKENVLIQVRLEEESKSSFLQRKVGRINNPKQRKWIYFSSQEASKAYDIEIPYNFYAVETSVNYKTSGSFPVPALEKKHIRNHHLTYALIWYSLGILVSLGYLIFHKQQGRLKFFWMFQNKKR